MKPYKRPYGGTPGPPVMYEKPSDPEDEGAGYGYTNAENIQEKDIYFYHSDHLGSTSYITDANGNATQFVCYKPYGEALVDEHNTSYEQPWKFNGKELDSETGLYYYGARYYEPVLALWYGVDDLAEKYPNMGGYVYCHGNPIMLVDPDGNDDYGIDSQGNIFLIKATDSKSDRLIAGIKSQRDSDSKYGYSAKINRDGEIKGLKYDKEGNLKNEQIEVNKGILGSLRKQMSGLVLSITEDENQANNLFEFLADNTNVEWGYLGAKNNQLSCTQYQISTSHNRISESISGTRLVSLKGNDWTPLFHKHSHPVDNSVLKDVNLSPSDADKACWDKNPDIIYSIYNKRGGYYNYSKTNDGWIRK